MSIDERILSNIAQNESAFFSSPPHSTFLIFQSPNDLAILRLAAKGAAPPSSAPPPSSLLDPALDPCRSPLPASPLLSSPFSTPTPSLSSSPPSALQPVRRAPPPPDPLSPSPFVSPLSNSSSSSSSSSSSYSISSSSSSSTTTNTISNPITIPSTSTTTTAPASTPSSPFGGPRLEGVALRTSHPSHLPQLSLRALSPEDAAGRLGLTSVLGYAVLGALRLASCWALLVVTEREQVGLLPSGPRRFPVFLAKKIACIQVPAVRALTEQERRAELSHLEALQVFLDDSGFYYSVPGYDLSRCSQARFHQKQACQAQRAATADPSSPLHPEDLNANNTNELLLDNNNNNNLKSNPLSNSGSSLFTSDIHNNNNNMNNNNNNNNNNLCMPDPRFHWNLAISSVFYQQRLGDWVVPVIDGFISITDVPTSDGDVTYAMISRRGCQRAGARYYVRGADPLGRVANFAETEQLVIKGSVVSSFVQVRGSIPLLWTQKAKGYTSPKPQIVPSIFARAAFQRHFEALFQGYPGVSHLGVISLIDQSGNEGDLADEFATQIKLLGLTVDRLRYIAWDFHEECRGNQFENVDRLVSMLADDLDRHCYFMIDAGSPAAAPALEQSGLIRTNCIDCLDRTNVVQSECAKYVLYRQLRHLGILMSAEDLDQRFAMFDSFWKNAWADNADAMSRRYTGTGALKTDYTRTGKRSAAGALSDAVLSTRRTLNRNLRDDIRQHGTDLFLGEDEVGAPPPSVLHVLADTTRVVPGIFRIRKCSLYSSRADDAKGSSPGTAAGMAASTDKAQGDGAQGASSAERDRDAALALTPASLVIYTATRSKIKTFPLGSLRQAVRSDQNNAMVQLHFEYNNCPHAKYFVLASPRQRERFLVELSALLHANPTPIMTAQDHLSPNTTTTPLAHLSGTNLLPSLSTTTTTTSIQSVGQGLSLFVCTHDMQHRSMRNKLASKDPFHIPHDHDMYAFGISNILSSEINDLSTMIQAQLGRRYEPVILSRTDSTLLLVLLQQAHLLRSGNVRTNFLIADSGPKKRSGLIDKYRSFRAKASGATSLPKLVRVHNSVRMPTQIDHRDGLLGEAAYLTIDDETVLCFVNIGASHTPVRLEDEWPLMATFHHIFVFGATPFLPEDAIQLASTVRWKSPLQLMVGSCQTGITPVGSHWLTCRLPVSSREPFSPSGLVTIQLSKLHADMKPSPSRASGVPDPAVIATAPFLRCFVTTPPVKKSLRPDWPQGLSCVSYMTDYRQLQTRHLTLICYDAGITDANVLCVGSLPLRVTGPFELKMYHPSTFLCVGTMWGLLDSIQVTTPPTERVAPLPSPQPLPLSAPSTPVHPMTVPSSSTFTLPFSTPSPLQSALPFPTPSTPQSTLQSTPLQSTPQMTPQMQSGVPLFPTTCVGGGPPLVPVSAVPLVPSAMVPVQGAAQPVAPPVNNVAIGDLIDFTDFASSPSTNPTPRDRAGSSLMESGLIL